MRVHSKRKRIWGVGILNIFLAYIGPVSMIALLAAIGFGIFAFTAMFLMNLIHGLDEALEWGITYGVGLVSVVTGLYVAGLIILAIIGLFGVTV